jgi:hypothetical protein
MPFLRFVIWTSASVGFGVFLASAQFGGKTPLQHMDQAWSKRSNTVSLDGLKDGVKGAFLEVRSGVTHKPAEHYTSEDREALNKIVAKRGGSK